jgi:hypothetical protein
LHARHILLREITPTPEPTPLPDGEPTPEPTPTATALPEGAPTPTPTPAPRTREEALALATELRGRLEQGEDFAALAEEYSDDTGVQGGDLGWFAQGMMVAPFDEAAFSLPVGEISEPISTTFGIHLIEVLEKDPEHAKDVAQLQQERAQAYDAWLQEQVAALQVERGDVVANLPRELQ